MLVGIVKKNAIMMIDFAIDAQREHGKTPADAIHEGCLLRFRPIMMTTMCALMATLPIALGLGAGGESRRALGLTRRRRTGRFAMPDALHHAGDLSLHGIVPGMGDAQTRQKISGHRIRNKSGNGVIYFTPLPAGLCRRSAETAPPCARPGRWSPAPKSASVRNRRFRCQFPRRG